MTDTSLRLAEAIEQLRERTPETRTVPTLAQVRRIVDDLSNAVFLQATLARPELANLSLEDVLDVAEELGKHRARVRKDKGPKSEPVPYSQADCLIPLGREQLLADVNRQRKRERDAAMKARRERIAATGTDEPPVPPLEKATVFHLAFIPPGWNKDDGAGHGRDIGKSLAAVIVDEVTDAEIDRFLTNRYGQRTRMLSATHVYLLHWVATQNLTGKLLEAPGIPDDLAQLFVQAYDLLDITRRDALEGLQVLVRAGLDTATDPATPLDLDAVHAATVKCRWVAPADVDRLSRFVEAAVANPDSDRVQRILATKLYNFAGWVRQSPSTFALHEVEQLNMAHLQMILSSAGLLGGEQEEKQVAAELRTRLVAMGFANDLDREIPEGLKAYRQGRLEDFYASRQARSEGEPDWASLYVEAPDTVSVPATVPELVMS